MAGLAPPPVPVQKYAAPAAAPFPQFAPTPAISGSFGGVLPFMNASAVLEQRSRERDANAMEQMAAPVLSGLAAHIKAFWTQAYEAKQSIANQMIEAMYARRGEYTATKKSQIAAAKQPAIYMMLAASKMRQVESLLRDVLLGSGTEKPWTLSPTPSPDLPPEEVQKIVIARQALAAMAGGAHG